jgi:aminobenzoyl-glutamate utilization protein A
MSSASATADAPGLPDGQQFTAIRRDLHRYAEPGWCEFRTTARIVAMLRELAWRVEFGKSVVSPEARMGVPSNLDLDRFYQAALASGADPEVLEKLRGGLTGAVATLQGAQPGPTIALRFDIDANFGGEAESIEHFPVREGFASINSGIHHNCGHDGHTAIGLGVARALSALQKTLRGTVRIIFQPAEEGLRGATAMVAAGMLDGVDYLIAGHIGVQALKLGEVITGYRNILASTKFDATFRGKSAHAALSPQVGQNALLAACVATQNLLALPRHGEGETRVNVGLLSGGHARNAIPASAMLAAEIRADTTAILEELERRAENVLKGAAIMHGVEAQTTRVGSSCGASSDPEMLELIAAAARTVNGVQSIRGMEDFKASDDVAIMMATVQANGGKAVYFGLGTPLDAVHHNPRFDFDERILPIGVALFVEAVKLAGATQ